MPVSSKVNSQCKECGRTFQTDRVSLHEGTVALVCPECLEPKELTKRVNNNTEITNKKYGKRNNSQ
jgi:DNA-directed RNA polymerase subunit RPC12/RpoP